MKQGESKVKVAFDDKDIIIDDAIWQLMYDDTDITSHCESAYFDKSLFFIGEKAYTATIWEFTNTIIVDAVGDNGILFNPDIQRIIDAFEAINYTESNDIIAEHKFYKNSKGDIIGIYFQYFHTNINV